MRSNETAPEPKAEISGAQLKDLYDKAAKGETIKADGRYITDLNGFRRAFASHPELAKLEGRDEEAADADAAAERDRERQATLARIAELESYLDANQKTFEANQKSIEALQDERDKAVARAEKAEKEVADLKAAAKPAEPAAAASPETSTAPQASQGGGRSR